MSSIVVNGDTSGAVTLSAPAVAGTVTVTLPSTSGTMLTTASTTGISGSAISSGTVPEAYGGTGTSTGYYGFKNRIINGAMVIDQRNAGATGTSNGVYTVDRWNFGSGVAGKMTYGQNRGSLTPPAGFSNYFGFITTTAYTVGASEFFLFTQEIEGFNVADFDLGKATAKTFTLSFWVNSTLTGTFGGVLSNSAQNRSFPFTYTINAASTWEQKTVTVVGDTTGTWLTTNGKGLSLLFGLGVGSTFNGTATGAWQAATYLGATGATSVVATLNATWNITGVQLEKGSTATSFDYRPYGTELQLAQRYYAKMISTTANASFGAGYINSSTVAVYYIKYPTTMRAAPTFSTSSLVIESAPANSTVTSVGTASAGTDALTVGLTASGGGQTTGQATLLRGSTTTAFVDFSAEL